MVSVILQIYSNKELFGTPKDSVEGIPPLVLFTVMGLFLMLTIYIAFRVQRSLKEDNDSN
ncbi:MAG: hypothetical protein MI922_12240 [Bacteroidales bacterium]|nr:hypothetical protein [Bacteroidales bacterium]